MHYKEDDFLMLSGIQHYYYCKRQWSLIHIENQWQENRWTIEGQIVHKKTDNPYIKEKRHDIFISRAMHVASSKLGLSGILDVVEFYQSENGIEIPNRRGKWIPTVVEYKRGKEKNDLRDIVQLVAGTICLEENLNTVIDKGYLYYNATNKKIPVEISPEYRNIVQKLADEMHHLYRKGQTTLPETCQCGVGCSLEEVCMKNKLNKYLHPKSYFNSIRGDKNYEKIT